MRNFIWVLIAIPVPVVWFASCSLTTELDPLTVEERDGGEGEGEGEIVRRLVFDNSESSLDLVGFPVMVELSAAAVEHELNGGPDHLAFMDSDGVLLPFDVETWVPGGVSIVWVRVPLITAGSQDDYISMHFGVPGGGVPDPPEVWQRYEQVTHLGDALDDRTGKGHLAQDINVVHNASPRGMATYFSGEGDQRVTFSNSGMLFNGWSSFVLELWVKPDYATTADVPGVPNEPRVLGKGGSLSGGRLFVPAPDPNPHPHPVLQVDWHFDQDNLYQHVQTPVGQWTYIVYTFDGQTLRMYRDGEDRIDNELAGAVLPTADGELWLGGQSHPMKGWMDELRVGQWAPSPDWVHAQYLSMTGQFVTFESE